MRELEGVPKEEQGEQERGRKAIWLVDDDEGLVLLFLRQARSFKLENTDFVYYQEGEKAIEDFDKLAEIKSQLPSIILLDYSLYQEVKNPRYRTGLEVIEALKKVCEQRKMLLPEIIAFSSNGANNMELIEAGAKSSVIKTDSKAIGEFLKSL